ncbi:MAG: hypothetical protein FD136_761 [Chitinophagaceae bacterium]|nr:MAG: hypothetical protein FD136_761 [Chitinophagaceae bacterium]
MIKMKKYSLFFIAFLSSIVAHAQTAPTTDLMRSNGKIFVVMAVVVTILVGLFIYVASIDRKISRLEKGDHSK